MPAGVFSAAAGVTSHDDGPPKPVVQRLLPSLVIIVVVLMAGSGALLWHKHQKRLGETIASNASAVSRQLQMGLDQQAKGLAAAGHVIAADRTVQKALREGDVEPVLAQWRAVFETLKRQNNLTHFYFLDKNRVCLFRLHNPQKLGDLNQNLVVIEAERTGKTAAGIELGKYGTFALRVAQPVFEDGRLVGYVELGKEIEDMLQAIAAFSGNQLAAVVRKEYLNRQNWETGMGLFGREAEWDRLTRNAVIYASQGRLPDAFALWADNHAHGERNRIISFDSQDWLASAMSLKDVSGKEVGDLLIMRDITADRAAFARLLLLSGTGGGVLLAFLLGFIYVLLRRTDAGILGQQTALKESEQSYRNQFANNSAVMLLIDPEDGAIIDANAAALSFYGYPRERLLTMDITDINTLPTYKVRQAMNSVSPERGRLFPFQHRLADGSMRDVEMSLSSIQFGERIVLHAIVQDITERKRLEMELNKLAAVVHHSSEFVSLATLEGQMIYLNEAGAKTLGVSSEEIEQISILQILPEHLRAKAQDEFLPALMRQGCWEGELEYRNLRTGELINVYAMSFVINDPATGTPLYLANTSRDITERKRAEEALCKAHDELELRVQERTAELQDAYRSLQSETQKRMSLEERLRQSQKMEAIGTLAGGIAHDFNNVLAGIIGFSELVEGDLPVDSPLQRYMKRILKASFRGRDLVKQILTFSRKTEYIREPVCLSPIIDETVQLLRASLPATIEIVSDIRTAGDMVRASTVELQQILMNLATNAARAMSEKGGTLYISLTDIDFEPDSPVIDPGAEPGEYVQLTVEDTGIGMTPDVMKRIFEPFFTTRGVGEGTGMGLAVVYGIVKGLQGTIAVESEPQAGSTFRIFLPKVDAGDESQVFTHDPAPRGTERVLFVDDEDLLAELGRELLEKLGYIAVALTDSTDALNLFLSDPYSFDLVITDQTMPKLTGLNLARKLLKTRDDIPIILCTGHSDSVSPEIAKDSGIKELLMKPVGKGELTQAIRRVLDATEARG